MAYKNNAKDIAYQFILNKIKDGEWNPGEKIWTEDVLMEKIGVSRMAIRNAVEKLSGMGLLRKVQGSGTFVEKTESSSIIGFSFFNITTDELMKLLELRRYLEPATVEMFIANHDENDLNDLRNCYEVMEENINNIEEFHKADFDFHKILAKGSKNPYVIKIFDLLMDISMNQQKNLYESIGPKIGLEYHQIILKYIEEEDRELAPIYMKKHIEATIVAVTEGK